MDATATLALASCVLAAVFAAVGLAARTQRLPRNGIVGIQTESVRADDERWRVGHRAAASLILAAAGPPLLLAAALVAIPPDEVADWLLVYALVGVATGGLVALAVRRADRATSEVDP